jgi:putative transcriptional regulator
MKNRLKVFRAMHDLTQESLAGKLGVTRQTIVSIETGKYEPSIGLAFRIARLFNVKIEDIFEYEGPEGEYHGSAPVFQSPGHTVNR